MLAQQASNPEPHHGEQAEEEDDIQRDAARVQGREPLGGLPVRDDEVMEGPQFQQRIGLVGHMRYQAAEVGVLGGGGPVSSLPQVEAQ